MVALYDLTIPTFVRQIKNVRAVLKLGQEHAAQNNIPESELTTARLAPDMGDLSFQIKVITNMVRSGVFFPEQKFHAPFFDKSNDADFASMDARLQALLDDLAKVPEPSAEEQQAAEGKEYFVRPKGEEGPEFKFSSALSFLTQFLFPQIWFHYTTAYNILRHKGVPLGKVSFLASGAGPFT